MTTQQEEIILRQKIQRRYFQALNYLSIYIFVLTVYGSALVTDYLLFILMWWLIKDDAIQYPLVSMALDYAKIALALLFILGAVVHGVLATISQVRLDLKFMAEDERQDEEKLSVK